MSGVGAEPAAMHARVPATLLRGERDAPTDGWSLAMQRRMHAVQGLPCFSASAMPVTTFCFRE
jgi:hypothetical protein